MEVSSQEGEMPMPINSTYGVGHGHVIHHDPAAAPHNHNHNHIIPSPAPQNQIPSSNGPIIPLEEHVVTYKKVVRYRECLKNHAAAIGGNATDGCGEFMPSGEEGTLEALTCSACNCHRNFHRKEVEGENYHPSSYDCNYHSRVGRKLILGHHRSIMGPAEALGYHHHIPSRAPQAHQMLMPHHNMSSLPSESDEQDDHGGGTRPPHQLMKKRFRTKFSQEQKEKMLNFAEKVGWKIQKQEESVLQQFCQEVGVKRRVLKVWMHNNKHNLAKKNNQNNNLATAQNQI